MVPYSQQRDPNILLNYHAQHLKMHTASEILLDFYLYSIAHLVSVLQSRIKFSHSEKCAIDKDKTQGQQFDHERAWTDSITTAAPHRRSKRSPDHYQTCCLKILQNATQSAPYVHLQNTYRVQKALSLYSLWSCVCRHQDAHACRSAQV